MTNYVEQELLKWLKTHNKNLEYYKERRELILGNLKECEEDISNYEKQIKELQDSIKLLNKGE